MTTTSPDRQARSRRPLLASVPDAADHVTRPRPARPASDHARPVLFGLDLAASAVASALLSEVPVAVVLPLVWTGSLTLAGCHARRVLPAESPRMHTIAEVALVLILLAELVGSVVVPGSRSGLVAALVASAGAALLVRGLLRVWHRHGMLHGLLSPRRVVLVGGAEAVARALDDLAVGPGPVDVVGACILGGAAAGVEVPVGRGYESLRSLVSWHRAEVVLAVPCRQVTPTLIRRLAWDLEGTDTELLVSPGLPAVTPSRTTLTLAGSVPVVHVRPAQLHGSARVVKDVCDRVAAVLLVLLLSPLLVALLVVIRLDSPGSPLFRQVRLGRDEQPFVLYKLRTMATDADQRLDTLRDLNEADGVLFKVRADPRITRVGAVLRRWSLDELPQLWNVVKGQMSLVGPRPPLPSEVATYEADVHRRMVVKPGLTGLWQVSGRSDLSWRQAVHLDLFYVDNWSLALDLSIMWRTVRAVFVHEGAY